MLLTDENFQSAPTSYTFQFAIPLKFRQNVPRRGAMLTIKAGAIIRSFTVQSGFPCQPFAELIGQVLLAAETDGSPHGLQR